MGDGRWVTGCGLRAAKMKNARAEIICPSQTKWALRPARPPTTQWAKINRSSPHELAPRRHNLVSGASTPACAGRAHALRLAGRAARVAQPSAGGRAADVLERFYNSPARLGPSGPISGCARANWIRIWARRPTKAGPAQVAVTRDARLMLMSRCAPLEPDAPASSSGAGGASPKHEEGRR